MKESKVIVVTGVTGQDGSLMVDYLLAQTPHRIYGTVRRLSVKNHFNLSSIDSDRFSLIDFDLTDPHSIERVVRELRPDYFINFASQSFVGVSWDLPRQTFQTNATAVLDILEALRTHAPQCRFYNAGSSEEFGDVLYSPQDELHPLRPRSPYGASKAAARHLVKVYRDSYHLYAVQGWLFNHEGVRRGEEFVTRKITMGAARIVRALENKEEFSPISLGNLDAKRDWSDAEDFVEAVWLMLNQDSPVDYVFACGETHTIREFVKEAFGCSFISGYWEGSGCGERFLLRGPGVPRVLVDIDRTFYRPAEVELLWGDPSRAEKELGWVRKTDFKGLVKKMYQRDYDLLSGDC